MALGLGNFPYRVSLESSVTNHHHPVLAGPREEVVHWCVETIGISDSGNHRVQEYQKQWVDGGNPVGPSDLAWTVKQINYVRTRYYFRDHRDAVMFKLAWGGQDD
jgi:hypothetical protein